MDKVYIYALRDDDQIFYIGKTKKIEQRIKNHVSQSVRLWNEKDMRIQDILANNRRFSYEILKTVDQDDAEHAEMELIREYLAKGYKLLNCMVYKSFNRNHKIAGLTPTQRQVLIHLSQDKDTNDIAKLIEKSPRTVETIRQNIKKIAQVKTMSGLMVWAIENGVVTV